MSEKIKVRCMFDLSFIKLQRQKMEKSCQKIAYCKKKKNFRNLLQNFVLLANIEN